MYKKKDLLNEVAGVPKVIEDWVHLLSDVVIEQIEQTLNNKGWENESNGSVINNEIGEEVDITAYKTENEFDGKIVMNSLANKYGVELKEFIKSNTFKNLPIWRPDISLEIIGLPQFVYDQDFKDKNNVNAAMRSKIGVNKLGNIGKQPVMSHVNFHFEPYIPEDSIDGVEEDVKKDIEVSILGTVGHELLHAYQTFKQMESGKESHFGPEMILNTIVTNPSAKTGIVEEWDNFLHLVYLHLSFEVNARVNEMYYILKSKNIKTQEDFLRVLKNSEIWRTVERLESFDAKQFLKDFKIPEIPKSNDPLSHLFGDDMMKMELRMRGLNPETDEKLLKSLINLWDVILRMGNEVMKSEHGVDIPMDGVPEKAKEDPYYFFKFFEKRFHKRAKKFKKKLYRLATLVLDQDVQSESIKKKETKRG